MKENYKYFYFRFTENFLTTQDMLRMKSVEPWGYQFIYIFLRLSSLSLEKGGYIKLPMRQGYNTYAIDLASFIGEDPKVVGYAIEYFVQNGLIEISYEEPEEVKIYIPHIKTNTGRSSLAADKRRQRRILSNNNQDLKVLPEQIHEIQERKGTATYGTFGKVRLLESEYQEFFNTYQNADYIIKRLDRYKAMKNVVYDNDYAALLKFAEDDGIKKEN